MKRMNPYLIVAADFFEHGGMDRANLELARLVLSRGHPLHLVAHRVSSQLRVLGAHVHQVPRPFGLGLPAERGLDFVGRIVAEELPAGARIVVNGGNCAIPSVNWVHFVHGADTSADGTVRSRLRRAIARWSERRALEQASMVIANSESSRRALVSTYSLSASSVRTVYCGVDSKLFFPLDPTERGASAAALGFPADLKRLIFVGALGDHRKGFGVLFDAWRTLAGKWRDVEIVVVGTGRLLRGWIERAMAENLGDRLRFLGYREDVPELLRSSDLLVAPSRYEPYGLNVAEALSSGLPVIASKASGACEALRGDLQELLLCDAGSTPELVAKLELWKGSREKYRRAALKASRLFQARSWEAMSTNIYTLIEQLYQ
jgi:glycosyltransferase involved in cell wall biosynthesis